LQNVKESVELENVMAVGLYKISTLAKLTGFGVQAIRNWEHRHNLLSPQRTDGGHRLYTEDDLATLRRVRELLDQGLSIGEVAVLARQAVEVSGLRQGKVLATAARLSGEELDGSLARSVLDALPHGVVLTDAAGKTRWINQGITDLCGYTLADMNGRTPGSVLQGPGTDRRVVRRLSKAVAGHTACSEELLNYDSRNREYLAAVDIAPLWMGERLHGFVGLIRDLTRNRADT
jgi:PAS domain S-box-containing protein